MGNVGCSGLYLSTDSRRAPSRLGTAIEFAGCSHSARHPRPRSVEIDVRGAALAQAIGGARGPWTGAESERRNGNHQRTKHRSHKCALTTEPASIEDFGIAH